MLLKTQAATEIARFLANHPTPEQIVAFHPSPEVAERAYELIRAERDDALTEEERSSQEDALFDRLAVSQARRRQLSEEGPDG